MASLNSIIDSYKDTKEIYDRTVPNERIVAVLKFLTDNHFGRWTFAKANFGENFQWTKSDKSEPNYARIQKQGHFTLQDIENMKGINYGQFEFGASHHCIIAMPIYPRARTLLVLPITSLKGKTPSDSRDIVIIKEEYPFLLNDSIIHISRVQEIGLERFSIKDMDKYFLRPTNKMPYVLSNKHITESKKILKSLFDIK